MRQVSPKIANQSKLLADFVVLNQREPIPLKNVTSEIFKKVIEWCEYHAEDIPKPPDNVEEKRTDDIGEWDVEFLKVDKGTLFELVLAATYLDIKGLFNVTCKSIANSIKGKSPEEIRAVFNLGNETNME